MIKSKSFHLLKHILEVLMLSQLDNKIMSLNIFKKRKTSPTYREVVFFNKDAKKWNRILSGKLGAPVKSKWNGHDKSLERLTRKFGGIRKGQTVYVKEYDDFSVVAMIWPWKDKQHSTLKLSLIN